MALSVSRLDAATVPVLAAAYRGSVWSPDEAYYRALFQEQESGAREVLVARDGNEVAGHLTIKWRSDYPPFAAAGTPEINDLRVLERFRRRGVATALLDKAERRVFQRAPAAGIGFGLYADYGPAQQLYIRRGYVPDDRGLYHGNHPVTPGETVRVDDALVLFLVKSRF